MIKASGKFKNIAIVIIIILAGYLIKGLPLAGALAVGLFIAWKMGKKKYD